MKSALDNSPIEMPPIQAGEPQISMAPLIDVIFLLLIFFMVTTVFPENRGFIIEKPESEHSEMLQLKKLTFTLNQQGQILFKQRDITTNDVKRIVTEQLIAAPDTAVLLQVDKRASTEHLINLMDACKLGGAERVGIATRNSNPVIGQIEKSANASQ